MGLFDSLLSGSDQGWLSRLMQPSGPGMMGEQPNQSGSWIRPDSPLYNMFNGPFNAPLPTAMGAPSPYDEAGFAGAFRNAPTMSGSQTANVPMPLPRPPGLGQMPQQPPMAPPEVALPPNAQPTQGAAPQAAMAQAPGLPQQQTGMGDRLTAGAMNFSDPHAGLIARLVGAGQGLATGQRTDAAGKADANQAKMAQALYGAMIQRGIPHQQAVGIAQAAATDSKLAEALLPQALGLKPPATIEGVVADRMYKGGPSTGPLGLDAIRQLKSAEAQGTNEGTVIGTTQATAEMNLPSAVAQAKEALRIAGELRTHKGRDNPVFWHGKASAYLPDSAIPGNTDARDANGLLQQIKGGAFLEAFKTLKGGGQITEIEGKKATDAIARMDRSQSRGEFDRALSDYEGIIRLGIDRANQQAGRPAPGGFKGNTDWQQVQPGVRIRQVQ